MPDAPTGSRPAAAPQAHGATAFGARTGTGTHLLIDFGEVISRVQDADGINRLAALAGLPVDELARRYWKGRPAYDAGQTAEAYWTAVLGSAPSAARLAELVDLDMASWLHLDREVVAMIERTCGHGVPVSLLSNAPHDMATVLRAREEFAGFEHMLFSAEFGLVKPDPALFSAVVARLGVEPSHIVFVDDRLENVRAAGAIGMDAIAFTRTAACLARIEAALDRRRP